MKKIGSVFFILLPFAVIFASLFAGRYDLTLPEVTERWRSLSAMPWRGFFRECPQKILSPPVCPRSVTLS